MEVRAYRQGDAQAAEQTLAVGRAILHLASRSKGWTDRAVWEWIWQRAGFRPCDALALHAATAAAELNSAESTMANSLKRLEEKWRLIRKVKATPGMFGETLYAVEEPIAVLSGQLRVRHIDPQQFFSFGLDESPQSTRETVGDVVRLVPHEEASESATCSEHLALSAIEEGGGDRELDGDDRPSAAGPVPREIAEAVGQLVGPASRTMLSACRIDLANHHVTITAPSASIADRLRTRVARPLRDALRQRDERATVEVIVDDESARCSEQVALSVQQRKFSSLDPLQGSKELNKQTNNRARQSATCPTRESLGSPVADEALRLYRRLGDSTLWFWITIGIVIQRDAGRMDDAAIERLVAHFQRFPDVGPRQRFRQLGLQYPNYVGVKREYERRWKWQKRKFESSVSAWGQS